MTPINSLRFLNMNNAFSMNAGLTSAITMTSVFNEIGSFMASASAFGAIGQYIPVQTNNIFGNMTMPNFGATMPQMNFNFNSSMTQMPTFGNLTMPNFDFSNMFGANFYTPSQPINVELTSDKAKNAVAIAKSQIGIKEATGANDGHEINKYRNGSANGAAWCASFVSWCYGKGQNNNNAKTFGYETSCLSMKNKAQKAGFYAEKNSGYQPKPGDLVIWKYSESKGHVGIIDKVNPDGSYTTIEGNCADAVKLCTRNSSDEKIHGFIRMNEWLES